MLELSLEGTRYVIGRNPDAEICLDDPTVSRPHAELVCGPFGRWWIHDLGSTNGTKIEGERIRKRMLHHRDQVKVGDFILEFRHTPREATIRTKEESRPSISEETIQIAAVPPASTRARIMPAHLAVVTRVGREMLTTENGELRLDTLLKSFIGDELPGDAAMALRVDQDGKSYTLGGPHRRFGPDGLGPYCSQAVLRAVWESKEAVVATNLEELGDDIEVSLPAAIRPLAVVAAPLSVSRDSMDVLYVEFPWRYGTDQWRAMVELLADSYRQARMVWQMRHDLKQSTRIEHDLEMANELQSRLLPDCSKVRDLDVAVGYEPSHWVGGDYVDALHLADGRVLVVVADVCGKGLSAALISSSVHTMIHAHKEGSSDLMTIVERLNGYLCAHLPDASFVTLIACAIDPRSGAMDVLNAGHPPGVIVSARGEVRWLEAARNVAVGMLSNTRYTVQQTTLGRDETLLLYTDGAFERLEATGGSFDPEELAAGLAQEVHRDPGATAGELEGYLSDLLERRRGAQMRADDTTFLVARFPQQKRGKRRSLRKVR